MEMMSKPDCKFHEKKIDFLRLKFWDMVYLGYHMECGEVFNPLT